MKLAEVRAKFPEYDDLSDGDMLMAVREKFYPNMHPRMVFDSVEDNRNAHVTIDKYRDQWVTGVKQPMTGEDLKATALRLGGSANSPTFTAPNQLETGVRSGFQGMTFGGGDEIVAGATSLFPGRDYETELGRERGRLEEGRKLYPKTALASEIGGSLAVPGAATKAGASTAANIGRGAVAGAGTGAVQGFLSGEGGITERAENAMYSALVSGGVGGVLSFVPALIKSGVNTSAILSAAHRAAAKAGVDPDQMKIMAQQIYKAAEAEAPIPQHSVAKMVKDMYAPGSHISALEPDVTTAASKIMGKIEDLATDPQYAGGVPYSKLQSRRQLITGGMPADAGALSWSAMTEAKAAIDNLIETGLTTGPAVKRANDMWRRLSRHDDIQEALRLAESTASGFENGMRIEFRKILRNKKLWGRYNDTEKSLIKAIVDGTPFGNVMRLIAKMGPGSGQQHNFLGMATGASGGAGLLTAIAPDLGAMAVPIGTAATVGAGKLADSVSTNATRNAVQALDDAVVTGVTPTAADANLWYKLLMGGGTLADRATTRAPGVVSGNLGILDRLK